jgi:prophage antirepressor-like protein
VEYAFPPDPKNSYNKRSEHPMKILPTEFDEQSIRRVYDEETETWWFSVIDVVQVLTDSNNARRYWSDLKRKLRREAGSEQPYEKIVQLKLPSPDGKQRLTDAAAAKTLLRLVQSIPSPKAEPIKLWLAKVGYERMQEMSDPALSLNRARQTWQQHGRSDKWIQQRMTGQETRNKLTDYWSDHDIRLCNASMSRNTTLAPASSKAWPSPSGA